MVEGFEEETPPPPEGSMHINARGHRPLTSPFSRGRGSGLCVIGFNELSAVSYTFLQYIQCGSHFLPHCTHSSLSVCPLAITNHRCPARSVMHGHHSTTLYLHAAASTALHHSHICFNLFSSANLICVTPPSCFIISKIRFSHLIDHAEKDVIYSVLTILSKQLGDKHLY